MSHELRGPCRRPQTYGPSTSPTVVYSKAFEAISAFKSDRTRYSRFRYLLLLASKATLTIVPVLTSWVLVEASLSCAFTEARQASRNAMMRISEA